MSRTCEVCGERVYGLSVKRRVGLWLRSFFERMAVRADRWSIDFDALRHPSHLHLTDDEWTAFEEAIR